VSVPDPRAFASVVNEYELGRPEYPAGVLDLLGLQDGCRVLDLAAGTGKLTRLLARTGAHVTAVEPLAGLRERIVAHEVLDGTAEAIPLEDHAVDLVTVGDAWHWFDAEHAAGEVARVTRSRGRVTLLWQTPDAERTPTWTAHLGQILKPLRGDHPGFRNEQGRGVLDAHPAFGGLVEHGVPFTWTPTRTEYVAYIASTSFVAGLDDDTRAAVLDRVAAAVPREDLRVPFATRVWLTERR